MSPRSSPADVSAQVWGVLREASVRCPIGIVWLECHLGGAWWDRGVRDGEPWQAEGCSEVWSPYRSDQQYTFQ